MTQFANSNIVESHAEPFEGFRKSALFSNLTDADMDCFKDAVQTRLFKKDKILYLQEEPAKYFYLIRSGWVKLFYTLQEGEEVIVDMLTAGQMFGENAIFLKDFHMCSAQVVEDTELFSIPSKLLRDQISINPTLALNMLYSLSRHHRRHYSELAFNAMLSAPQRIGCFLLRLSPEYKESNVVFHLPYDKTLIAKTLGMKGATFSRALNILRKKPASKSRIRAWKFILCRCSQSLCTGRWRHIISLTKCNHPNIVVNQPQSRLSGCSIYFSGSAMTCFK